MEQLFGTCPSCEGSRIYLSKYDAPLKILKNRSWLICKDCDFEIQTEDFKKTLFCV
jgi:transcription elongation factor Elf1